MARGDHMLRQILEMLQGDVRRLRIQAAQHIADDAHGAGTAEGLQPSELSVSFLDGLELEPDGGARPLEALLGDLAVIEAAGAQAHATHRQALQQQRIEALADHHLGRSAADVDHQPLVGIHRAGMRHTRVYQSGFFQPGDDFDRMSERGAGALQEPALALGAAQGVGADDSHAVGVHGAQPLSEALQASQRPVRRCLIQPPAVAQARRQPHHFAQPVEDDQLAVRITRHDHVKTIGAKIDGG